VEQLHMHRLWEQIKLLYTNSQINKTN